MSVSGFGEATNRINLDREQRRLLSLKINELSVTIEGTRLEAFIIKLYQELERSGISFKPKTYLSDEWGCPNRVPIIGVPFYLAIQNCPV
jgi:hypothetical protein